MRIRASKIILYGKSNKLQYFIRHEDETLRKSPFKKHHYSTDTIHSRMQTSSNRLARGHVYTIKLKPQFHSSRNAFSLPCLLHPCHQKTHTPCHEQKLHISVADPCKCSESTCKSNSEDRKGQPNQQAFREGENSVFYEQKASNQMIKRKR